MTSARQETRIKFGTDLSSRLKLTFRFDTEPTNTEELGEQFGKRWLKLPDDLRQLLSNTFRHFMERGTWATYDEIAQWFQGEQLSEVEKLVERAVRTGFLQKDLDKDGYSTCMWIGSDPTRHEVQVENCDTVYAGCALDALWVFTFTSEKGIIRSVCPHCDARLSVLFDHGEIVKCEPQNILLFVGVKLTGTGTAAELGCPFINFFPDPDHLRAWLSKIPDVDGVLFSREETGKLAHIVVPRHRQITLELPRDLGKTD